MMRFFPLALLGFISLTADAAVYHVSPGGADDAEGSMAAPFRTVQRGLNRLLAGDELIIEPGVYSEKVTVPRSGTAAAPIKVRAAEVGTAVMSGRGVKGEHLMHLEDRSHVQITGLVLRGMTEVKDGSGIRIEGSGTGVVVRQCTIHDLKGKDAMGITVYGTGSEPISDLILEGNEIFDCESAKSEALVLNGNIRGFQVINNRVHDINNIGIDFIGGEDWVNQDRSKGARDGVCRGNWVYRCRSSYGGGYAAGIYVDGGRDILIENNVVSECDLGLEVGAENAGTETRGITVKDNLLFLNDKAGLVFGGYENKAGRVVGCVFENNLCYRNDRHARDQNAEVWIQWAEGNRVTGNTVWAGPEEALVMVEKGAGPNQIDGNRYYSEAGAGDAYFLWREADVEGFEAWKRISGGDGRSVFGPVDISLPAIPAR